jgi:hypothetical protein
MEISQSLLISEYKIHYKSKLFKANHGNWDIDYNNRKASINNINFFSLINCSLRSIQKRYNIDYTDSKTTSIAQKLLESCDVTASSFFLLLDWAKKHSKQIRIYGWESIYIPNSVLYLLAKKENNYLVEYIDLNRGYIHYFGKKLNSSYITTANYNRESKEYRLQITSNELQKIDWDKIKTDKISNSIKKAMNNRIAKPLMEYDKILKARLLDALKELKKESRNIFVLFAHLFYDVEINDNSPSFNDMCDWIKSTVDYFKGKNDFLIIKPHPTESAKEDTASQPNETLASYLQNIELSDNIKLLPPNLLSVIDLAEYMSCGLVWRSSVAFELTYLQIPCIIAGNPPYQILNFNYAKNRQDYFKLIDNSNLLEVNSMLIDDTIKYVYCLENIKHYYVNPLKANGMWQKMNLLFFLLNGNSEIKKLVDNLIN